MKPYKTIEFSDGAKLEVFHDEDAESPREWDNLSTMVCFHKRYNLGDKEHGYNSSDFDGWEELKEQIVKDHDPIAILPLFLFDHSGLSIVASSGRFRTSDPHGWDWGQVGFIFVSRENALEVYSGKLPEQIEKCLLSEVETYDQYLRGEVFWYRLSDAEGEEIDSCGGFYGSDLKENGILDNLPAKYINEAEKAA